MEDNTKNTNSLSKYTNLIGAILHSNIDEFRNIIDKPLLIDFNTEEVELTGGLDMMQYIMAAYLAALFDNKEMFRMLVTKMKLFMRIHSYKIVKLPMFLESFIALTCENGVENFDIDLEENCLLTSQIGLGGILELLNHKQLKKAS